MTTRLTPHTLTPEEVRLQTEVRRNADHPQKGKAAEDLAFRSTGMPLPNSMPVATGNNGPIYKPDFSHLEALDHPGMPPGASNAAALCHLRRL